MMWNNYFCNVRLTGRFFPTSFSKFREPVEQRLLDILVSNVPVAETPVELAPRTTNIPLMVTNLNTLAMPDRPIQNSQERQNHAITERLEGELRDYEDATSLHHVRT